MGVTAKCRVKLESSGCEYVFYKVRRHSVKIVLTVARFLYAEMPDLAAGAVLSDFLVMTMDFALRVVRSTLLAWWP